MRCLGGQVSLKHLPKGTSVAAQAASQTDDLWGEDSEEAVSPLVFSGTSSLVKYCNWPECLIGEVTGMLLARS